jgi:ubiquinone/menaquinone biosynthesis C-methylase UbiE
MIKCNVCNENLENKVYDTLGATSITSVCTTVESPTEVYYCSWCGHIQTLEMPDELSYYDETYNFLAESEEEDQIYVVENGNVTYRTQHQVTTLLSKLNLSSGIRILDYGCAKSSTMRELTRRNLSITPYLFDISERYTSFWKEFIEDGKWATYQVPEAWNNHFDVVTSFFSLEHISKLGDTLQNIKRVLVKDGYLYTIIPNTQTNPADLIVVDHPNHFTTQSLERLLFDNGFTVQEIDDTSHRGAYIVIAKNATTTEPQKQLIVSLEKEITVMGDFWRSAALRVKEFEKSDAASRQSAIYGAGFYGSFLASNLSSLESIVCFIDQNPFLQGNSLMQRPILHPRDLPSEVQVIYVALNPQHSRKIIQDIEYFYCKDISYFYI